MRKQKVKVLVQDGSTQPKNTEVAQLSYFPAKRPLRQGKDRQIRTLTEDMIL